MSRPTTTDHLVRPPLRKVGMAVISDNGRTSTCSCNWISKPAERKKVREDRAQAHLDKVHQGRGLWM